MIICRAVLGLLVLLPLAAEPARADVLEIAPTGDAVWLSGPGALVQIHAEEAVIGAADAADVATPAQAAPAHAMADTRRHVAGIPSRYIAAVDQLSARYRLSPALIEALVWQESRWREDAVSPAGARGLTQLMPGTARDLGVDPDDPFANLEGGARYLREQLNRFNGDLGRALAAYNAGPGRVISAGGIPRIRETQNYVASIIGRLSRHARSSQ
jgi:soluble lytic murein transglycosylase-like protein